MVRVSAIYKLHEAQTNTCEKSRRRALCKQILLLKTAASQPDDRLFFSCASLLQYAGRYLV